MAAAGVIAALLVSTATAGTSSRPSLGDFKSLAEYREEDTKPWEAAWPTSGEPGLFQKEVLRLWSGLRGTKNMKN